MVGLMVVLLMFFRGGVEMSMASVPMELMLFWGMDVEF